jgi:hypothetical protein
MTEETDDLFNDFRDQFMDGAPNIDNQGGGHPNPAAKAIKTKERQINRRLNSERQLENLLEWEFEPNAAYHIISGGDIDSLTFLKFVLRQQPLQYCALSTWCAAKQDIEELERYLDLKRIHRLDTYVGEIFKGSYAEEYEMLCARHQKHGGRCAIFRNHAKIFVGFGEKFDFVIESSANINTNPRTENTTITINTELAHFYKDFFDDIKSFERNFDDWKPYEIKE